MKTRILILLTLLITSTLTFAQEEEMRTVFGSSDNKVDHGGYGAFSMGYTQIEDKDALILGGRAGWLIDHHFTIGLAGYGFFNDIDGNSSYDLSTYTLAGGYGGLFLEPIIAPKFPVHIAIPILIGAGGATAFNDDYWNIYESTYYYDGSAFFVFEPGVELELNLVKFFRIGLGVSYRHTSNLDLNYSYYDDRFHKYVSTRIDSDALKGMNYMVTLKFGWF